MALTFWTVALLGSATALLSLAAATRARNGALAGLLVSISVSLLAVAARPWCAGTADIAASVVALGGALGAAAFLTGSLRALRQSVQAEEAASALRTELSNYREDASSKVETSERRYRQLAQITRLGVLETDAAGAIRFTSREFLSLLDLTARPRTLDDWIGSVHEEHRSELRSTWANALRHGTSLYLEFRRRPPQDSTWLRWELSPEQRTMGAPSGWIGTLRNVTERRQLESQISRNEKLESLGTLTSGLAHDFNNLLVGILGTADLILDGSDVAPALRVEVQRIHDTARQATDLVRHMLNFVGRDRTELRALDLAPLIGELTHILDSSSQKLRVRCQADSCTVLGDPVQLRQLLMNLITNAVEALGSSGGTVQVRLEVMELDTSALEDFAGVSESPAGPYAVLRVSDQGPGMDASLKSQVFEPFFTTKTTGRGLGMSVVLRVAERHQGGVRIISEPGEGCEVSVAFPLEDSRQIEQPAQPLPHQRWRGSGLILVVDDEKSVRSVARRMLERLGFTVVLASSGPEALDQIEEHNQELCAVILDLHMPGMSGDEVLTQMRSRQPELPILLCSGNGQSFLESPAAEGIVGFLQKPYQLSTLSAALQEILASDPVDPTHSSK